MKVISTAHQQPPLSGFAILIPSYVAVIRGLNDARKTVTNIIIGLSRPKGSGCSVEELNFPKVL